jgi:hypothetical protein
MIPEYSTKLFQCGSRCLSHRAICGDLAAPRQGGRSGNRERSDLTLHCHRRADRAVLQRHDRCVRVLSQAKSTLWCCRGDSSQTLRKSDDCDVGRPHMHQGVSRPVRPRPNGERANGAPAALDRLTRPPDDRRVGRHRAGGKGGEGMRRQPPPAARADRDRGDFSPRCPGGASKIAGAHLRRAPPNCVGLAASRMVGASEGFGGRSLDSVCRRCLRRGGPGHGGALEGLREGPVLRRAAAARHRRPGSRSGRISIAGFRTERSRADHA